MQNKTYLLFIGVIFVIFMSFPFSQPAEAIPAFARKTQFSCTACHTPSYPRLNAMGWAFKENGYQMPETDDTFQENVATNVNEYLELLKDLPLSFRLRGSTKIAPSSSSVNVDFQIPDELELIAGGRLYKDVSFYYMQGLGSAISGTTVPNKGFIQFNNIFQPGLLNFRLGKFGLLDWHLDGHRRLTDAPYLISMNRISHDIPYVMGSNQVGLEIYGRPLDGPVFYHLGVFNGNLGGSHGETTAGGGFFDNNNFKDLAGGVNVNIDTHRLGVFGYYGRYPVQNDLALPEPRAGLKIASAGHDEEVPADTDALANTTETGFFSTGMTLNMDFSPVQVIGIYAYGQNTASRTLLHGGFLEANYAFSPSFGEYAPTIIGIARTDMTTNITEQGTYLRTTLTPAVRMLLLTNLSLLLEYKVDLTEMNRSLGSITIESIF